MGVVQENREVGREYFVGRSAALGEPAPHWTGFGTIVSSAHNRHDETPGRGAVQFVMETLERRYEPLLRPRPLVANVDGPRVHTVVRARVLMPRCSRTRKARTAASWLYSPHQSYSCDSEAHEP
jgi:hypothetical protein